MRSNIPRQIGFSLAKVSTLVGLAAGILVLVLPRMSYDYGTVPHLIDSRTVVWLFTELHLMFAAFVLGVPIFAVLVECVGVATKEKRYDILAREFTRLLALAFTTTAALGVGALLVLVLLYPKVITYLGRLFSPTYGPYALLILLDGVLLVLYYYGWDSFRKWLHIAIGVLLNLAGTAVMCIANAWTTFMMSPAGVREDTGALISLSDAIQNPLWWPINVHRFIANVAFGGALVGAYAAIRFLNTKDPAERQHYDWMGYVGSFVAIWAFIPLPFAGYWLGKELYAYSAQMGTTLMGGAFSWLFIIQAILIAVLFIGSNYYMWIGLGRIPGGERYLKYILPMEGLLYLSMAIWMTPHTLVASLAEARQMGGAHHPLLGVFGVMSAKNTVVNIVILTTFLSFIFYRRANKERLTIRPPGGYWGPVFVLGFSCFPIIFCAVQGFASSASFAETRTLELRPEIGRAEKQLLSANTTVSESTDDLKTLARNRAALKGFEETPGIHHAAGYRLLTICFAGLFVLALLDMFILKGRAAGILQLFILAVSAIIVIYYGVLGYFVEAEVRIGFSVYQVMAVLFALVTVTAIDIFMFFGARSLGRVQWGKMPVRSQYVLLLLAVTFTLLMGLMGFARAGIRETWHVYGVLRDTSPLSFTPTLGYACTVVSCAVLIFFTLLFAIFWLGMRKTRA